MFSSGACCFRISDIQSEVSQLRTRLYSNVIQRLLSKSYVEEGKTTVRRTEVVTEVRMVETHPAFKHVQDCLDWVEEKQVLVISLNTLSYLQHWASFNEQGRTTVIVVLWEWLTYSSVIKLF